MLQEGRVLLEEESRLIRGGVGRGNDPAREVLQGGSGGEERSTLGQEGAVGVPEDNAAGAPGGLLEPLTAAPSRAAPVGGEQTLQVRPLARVTAAAARPPGTVVVAGVIAPGQGGAQERAHAHRVLGDRVPLPLDGWRDEAREGHGFEQGAPVLLRGPLQHFLVGVDGGLPGREEAFEGRPAGGERHRRTH